MSRNDKSCSLSSDYWLASESSRLQVGLAKSTKDWGWVDNDVIPLQEPWPGLGEYVAAQLTGPGVGGDRSSELSVEGCEVVRVEEVERVELTRWAWGGLASRSWLESEHNSVK